MMDFSIYKRFVELGLMEQDPEREKFRKKSLKDFKINIKVDASGIKLYEYQLQMLEKLRESVNRTGMSMQSVGRAFRAMGTSMGAISSMHIVNPCRDIPVRGTIDSRS